MSQRNVLYQASASESTDLAAFSKKLSTDLRRLIRKLQYAPVLSEEWIFNIDSLQHIANIAMMEDKIPGQKSNDGELEKTLWERDEMCVKFMLEEGKLNLVLRSLVEYKTAAREGNFAVSVKQSSAQLNLSEPELWKRMMLFEQASGMLLKCTLEHVEAVQTLDLPLLVGHCVDVMVTAAGDPRVFANVPDGEFQKNQEYLLIFYLTSILRRIEDLNEDRLLEIIENYEVVSILVEHIMQNLSKFSPVTLECAAEVFNTIVDTEYFKTHSNRYLKSELAQSSFLAMKPAFLQDIANKGYESKKKIRSLLDYMIRLEMTQEL